MIIRRVFLDIDHVGIVIEGLEEYHLMFDLQTVPNVDRLIEMIKSRAALLDEEGHTPPTTDWTPFFETLRAALEGTDIGA